MWHDDTFDIPAGAVVLASSAGCANQAFRYGERAYGLQFHPEVTPAILEDWIAAAPYLAVDDQRALRAHFENRYAALQTQADCLVENFLRPPLGRRRHSHSGVSPAQRAGDTPLWALPTD